MESLRIRNKDLYVIEVNDKGECIEFDLSDIGLHIKCYECLEKIKKIEQEMIVKEKELNEKLQVDKDPFSETNKQLIRLEQETFYKMREAMDGFLGQGACQKIFGDRNYYEMFDDLFKEFNRKRKELGGKSHFDKMGFKSNNINQRIMNKYNKNKKNVI